MTTAPPFSPLGPPPQNPWAHLTDDKRIDALVDEAVESIRVAEGEDRNHYSAQGTMRFAHLTLMGPPGRLQGGLHCVARLFPILHRIPAHNQAETFPCRIRVALDRGIPMVEPVPFEAKYGRGPAGRWWLTSRFLHTDRLDAAAWQFVPAGEFDPASWSDWRDRLEIAREQPGRHQLQILGGRFEGTNDLFWCNIGPEQLAEPKSPLRRFQTADGTFSLALICYFMDIVGAISQAFERFRPMFTTHVSLQIATDRIDAGHPLVCVADRYSAHPSRYSRAKPVVIEGVSHGTTVVETLLAAADFSKIYAYGWVSAHPMDLQKFRKAA